MAQVVGVQPHTFGVPLPPQLLGAMQLPQSRAPPQPSGMKPQSLPCAEQVVGVQLDRHFHCVGPHHIAHMETDLILKIMAVEALS